MFERIMVCLDGSALGEAIVPYAAEKAVAFKSKLILLQVIAPHINVPPNAGYVIFPGKTIGEADETAPPKIMTYSEVELAEIEREDGEATSYLEGIADNLRAHGLHVQTATIHGKPGEAIVRYAEHQGIKLIALATHGRSGIGRAYFGSVADYILKETTIPILIIRSALVKKEAS